MIEVEIRGILNEEEFENLKARLSKEGDLVEEHEREMIMLRGYPGYSKDPIERETDIRIRNTNGKAELMVKQKVSDNNVGRSELSLPLHDFEAGKQALKALGFSEGNWMHRKKHVYVYKGIEWSLVEAPLQHFYYEAEREVEEGSDLEAIHDELLREAQALGLSVLGPEEMREFIKTLDQNVNKEVSW